MWEMEETWVWSLRREDPVEQEMATHSSILAWKISWAGEPGGLQAMRLQTVRCDWVCAHMHTHTHTHTHTHFFLVVGEEFKKSNFGKSRPAYIWYDFPVSLPFLALAVALLLLDVWYSHTGRCTDNMGQEHQGSCTWTVSHLSSLIKLLSPMLYFGN